MVGSALIIVHPWDLARLRGQWNLRGAGGIDLQYEKHIRHVVRWYIEDLKPRRVPVGFYLGLKEFRIHPAVEGLQDFVLYDGEDNARILSDLGIRLLEVGGYALDICVKSFVEKYRQYFSVRINPILCLSTIKQCNDISRR